MLNFKQFILESRYSDSVRALKSWPVPMIGAFLNRYGKIMSATGNTPKMKHSQKKLCFANAQRTVLQSPRYRYVEGYAIFGELNTLLPLEHAWVVDTDGKLIDSTWGHHPDSVYLGVVFKTEYVAARLAEIKVHDSLLSDYRDRFRLVTGKIPASEALEF